MNELGVLVTKPQHWITLIGLGKEICAHRCDSLLARKEAVVNGFD